MDTATRVHEGLDLFRFGVTTESRGDTIVLRCPQPLDPLPDHLVAILRERSRRHPERAFLREKDTEGNWRTTTYGEARRMADSVAQSLIDRGCGPDRPLAILSDNSTEQAIVTFGAMTAQVPAMPISPAYSLMSQDHEKLRSIFLRTDPSVVFVQSPGPFARALRALELDGRCLLAAEPDPAAPQAELLGDWLNAVPAGRVEERVAGIDHDTVGKILLTSGSTGVPKGVLNTHRMMVSNQVAMGQVCAFMHDEPPVLVDWLPWNHTFGGNYNLNMVLCFGGTLHIDAGRPVPGRIGTTVANLREVSPTVYLNVPRGYDLLLPLLENDDEAREGLFRRLRILFFAGAALPANVWERLDKLAVATQGRRVPIITSLGSTETAPAATYMNWFPKSTGNIGVPLPGSEIKLVPNGDKLEVRMKGPNISPGYYREPELTRRAFDEDGFFRIGDAGRLEDENDPGEGIVFDGRVAENFKLMTGVWVHAGQLRLQAIAAAAPAIQDAVVTGQDRSEVGLLAFASADGCRSIAGGGEIEDLVRDRRVHDVLRRGLGLHNRDNPGSSTRIRRVMLITEPPQIDAGEITDKGYINQRAVLRNRSELVERLYDGSDDNIVLID